MLKKIKCLVARVMLKMGLIKSCKAGPLPEACCPTKKSSKKSKKK